MIFTIEIVDGSWLKAVASALISPVLKATESVFAVGRPEKASVAVTDLSAAGADDAAAVAAAVVVADFTADVLDGNADAVAVADADAVAEALAEADAEADADAEDDEDEVDVGITPEEGVGVGGAAHARLSPEPDVTNPGEHKHEAGSLAAAPALDTELAGHAAQALLVEL